MKTPSIFAIAIEALVTVSLIALLGLLTALIYALLSFLSAEPTTQSLLSQIPTDVTTAKTLTVTETLLPATTLALSSAKAAPKLEVLEQDGQTEIIAETATKPISKMTVQELRPLARERKIPNWRTLKKKELIYHLNV
jgi:hypothetical protein